MSKMERIAQEEVDALRQERGKLDAMARKVNKYHQALMDVGDPETISSYGDPGTLGEHARARANEISKGEA